MTTTQILAWPIGTEDKKPVARYYLENAWPVADQEWTLTYEAIQR